jgi:hypothetical protein
VLVLALIWWIWCLWKNEPRQVEPVAAIPASLEPDATIPQPE